VSQPHPHLLRAHLQMHASVLAWGATAILGKLISLPASRLVLLRMALVSAVLLCVPRVRRGLWLLPRPLLRAYAGIGLIVALHWLTFYGAIKLANASVAASCMGLAPVFVALLGPLVEKKPLNARELWIGAWVTPGVALVAGGTPFGMRAGLLMGAVSALLAAWFGLLNKRFTHAADPLVITCVEIGAGALAIALWLALTDRAAFALPGARDFGLLCVLAIGCTLVPFALSLNALRQLEAFTAQLLVNLEPVYAIALGAVLLDEQRELSGWFYLGAALLLSGIFGQPLLSRRARVALHD
jgi:drug/metabolite transporter (DMT)-like permease